MAFLPGYALVEGAAPTSTAFVLHGILGSWRNWRSFAQRLVAKRPDLRLLLVDLRNHADSRGAPPPHTLAACADDLLRLADHLRMEPAVAIGHSFGGKVALELGLRSSAPVREVWMLDTSPGARSTPDTSAGSPDGVIAALRRIPLPIPSRDAVIPTLTGQGFPLSLAQWLTTGVEPDPGHGYRWRFDLDGIEALLASYYAIDRWPALERPPAGTRLHAVRGSRSDRWSAADCDRLDRIQASGGAEVHVLPDAGHWLHADNPEALLSLLATRLGTVP